MIKIAFCDDDSTVLDTLHEDLALYRASRNKEIADCFFQNPIELITEIEKGMRYDIIFLDILMPGENGMDAAAEIRTYDENVKIVFLTSSSEYAVQSYRIQAFYYQLKPISRDEFFHLMDSILVQLEKQQAKSLLLSCKNGITRIKPEQLEYCEVIHRTLLIHLISGEVLESIGTMEELNEQLKSFGNFLRPHRSYIVNLDYIQNLSFRAIITTSQAVIPIPRGKYNSIKNMFLEYAFTNR